MSDTITASEPPHEINYRTLPIWAIPQLAFLRERLGLIVTNYTPRIDFAQVVAYLPTDDAYYLFHLYKWDMNNHHVPAMFRMS